MKKNSPYEFIFENLPDGIVLFQIPSAKIALCNSVFAKSIGYTKEELIGQSITDFIHPDNTDSFGSNIYFQEEIFEPGKKQEKVKFFQHKHKDGRIVDKEVRIQTLRVDDEDLLLCYDRDISNEIKAAEIMNVSHFEITQRQLAINRHAIIAITNLSGTILYVNDRFCEISQYSKEELLGKNHRLINSGFHSKEFFGEMFSTLKKGDAWQGEIRNQAKDGSFYWVDTTIAPLKNTNGKIERYFAVRTNITSRKQIEEDLKTSELRFHAIFDQAPVGIALVESKTGKYIQINPKFCDILGYREDEIVNKRYLDITHPEDLKVSLDHWHVLLEGNAKFPFFEKRYIRKDGRIVWTNLTCVRLFEREDDPSYHLVIIIDITESKKANETLKQYMQELENVNHTKDKFLSIIAHDLRNPFAGIIGITELLDTKMRDELINESMKLNHKYIQMVQSSAQSAFTLLENLLQWARSQTGEISVRPKNTSLTYLLSETVPIVSGNAFKKNITIEQALSENDVVFADESLVSTILRNLLTNSIKFTLPNGKIVLSTQSKDNLLEISISDTGIGIDQSNLEKIFKIDSKFSKPGTNNEKGTGLGLILCKEFVEKQGGTIWVESQLGKGSVVTFTLPLGK